MIRRLSFSFVAVIVLNTGNAWAEKDRFDIGEPVKSFTLKVVNDDVYGEPFVGVERYVGPEAKDQKKALLLSFFATYCEPCKKELPFLTALYDLYREKGLMVMSISIDKEPEKIDEAKVLANAASAKFPVLSDRFNIVAKRFYIEKLPCVYLIDGQGKVAMVNIGYNDDISKTLLDSIRKLIGEPTTDPVPDALSRHMKGNTGAAMVEVPKEGGEVTTPPAGEGGVAAATVAPATDGSATAADGGETKVKGKKKGKSPAGKGKKKGKAKK
jgi:thiol-disulfide isomerase/thioredoxin